MKNAAVLIVDMQSALVKEHPNREGELIETIRSVAAAARGNGVELIYVRHCGRSGGMLERGAQGWEIHEAVAPQPGEKIFDKRFNSAFRETGLREYLEGKGIKTIVLMGMQTEYCIDATCKVAFEYGYGVVIPAGGSSTYDNALFAADTLQLFYESFIWGSRFAKVIPADEVARMLSE